MSKITFAATGDCFIARRLPEGGYDGFDAIREVISAHDVKFTNLETTFHDYECAPAAMSGGTWAMADPRCLDDMQRYGFNLYTTANNHSGDYGTEGVLATIRHLKERDMVFAGTGATLALATRAAYLETPVGRAALIGLSMTFNPCDPAGPASADMMGRPGVNPLHVNKLYHVEKKYIDQIREIAAVSGVNAFDDYLVALGFAAAPQEGTAAIGGSRFIQDDSNWVESSCSPRDMARITAEIREARRMADYVLVSIHSHEADGVDQAVPALALKNAAKAFLDAGADAILGHGPHELRGIEIYNGKPIFYSLGNFIFQTDSVPTQPADAFVNKGLSINTKIGDYMDVRTKNETAGYPSMPVIWKTVIAGWTVEDGKLTQIQLYPVSLGFGVPRGRRGVPVPGDDSILEYMAELSRPFGTNIRVENHVGYIDL